MMVCSTLRQQGEPKMALALPARTTELVNQGNALMTNFQDQGRSLHQLAFKEKEVAARIQTLIDNFKYNEVVEKASETIGLLKEAQQSYQNIKDSVNRMDAKEKELSAVIQQIFERQQQGEGESRNIQAEIAKALQIILANDQQIRETQANLERMKGELGQLERAIEDAERKMKKKKKKRRWWKVIAVITVVGVAGLIGANKSVKAARKELDHRREMFQHTQNHFNTLQGTQQANYANKARLDGEQAQRQNELNVIAGMLIRLRPAQQDTIKYRQYLLSLSDALTQVNSYIQVLERNLDQNKQVQAAGIPPDGPIAKALNESHAGLKQTWNAAKGQPAVQITLNLADPNSVDATLNAIKAANFHG